jgi:hypothetical protein
MKLLAAVLIVLLLLAIKPAEAITIWSQNQESIPTGSHYLPKANYSFQINWIGSNESYIVSNVLFESNFNGTLTNYTSLNNDTNGNYWINFTDLSGGTYAYRWYAADNESNWNSTDQFSYIINPNSSTTIKLYLNGTDGNKSYNLNDAANFTVFLSIPSKTIYLNSSYPSFATQTNSSVINYITNLIYSGLYSLTAYWNGDQNYSSSSKTYYFDTVVPQYSNLVEYPSNPAGYYFYRAYTFGIRWTSASLSQVWFESNHTGTLKNYTASTAPPVQNDSINFNITLVDLPSETFAYRWIAIDNISRYVNNSQRIYYILKGSPLTIEVTSSKNILNQTKATVICRSVVNEVDASNFKLFRNSTLIENNTLFSRKDEQTFDEGVYTYICNNTETQNFTNQTIAYVLNATLKTSITGTLDFVGPSSAQVNLGEYNKSNFFLENNLGYSIYNLSVNLTGISKNWYTINELPSSIPNNFSLSIKINFSIPTDAEQKDYNITLIANGKTSSGATKSTSKSVILTVAAPPPAQEYPPVYSQGAINTTVYNETCLFSLKWDDDKGLSGYIFSSNMTGNWTNDSWAPFSGAEAYSYVSEILNLTPNSMIAWKFYANDSNNLWTESDEYYVQVTGKEGNVDMKITITIVSVFVVFLAVILLVLERIRSKSKKTKKENVVYVYSKEDVK